MQVVSTQSEFLTRDFGRDTQVFVGGEAVFVSLDPTSAAFDGMVKQVVRPSSFKVLGADGGGLYVGVPEGVCDALSGVGGKTKFYLLLDLYLRYMQKMKGDFLFIGGVENGSDTNLEFYLVKAGKLVRVIDKRLPRLGAYDFSAQFALALSDALDGEGGEPRVYVAYPLELPESIVEAYGLTPVSEEGLSPTKGRWMPNDTVESTTKVSKSFALPVTGIALGLALAGAQAFYHFSAYKQLQADYINEVQPVEAIYAQGGAMLAVLTNRQRMLDEPIAQEALLHHWKTLAVATKETDAEITRLAVFGPRAARIGLGGREIDFELDLRMPKHNDIPLRVFAKQILTQVANQSGYDMWLRASEAREANGVMSIEIEGAWPNVN